ncbi:MAG: nicotinate phosphoribosyltransferase [Rhodanobacteraceae bacterium]|nr:MAG: nicotinate phosphoribosyltransferase [Rhodanobacteraceae bacterium]
MIIESLLDTDLYKFTMMQAVLHRFPAAEVEYQLRYRTHGQALRVTAAQVRREIAGLCRLRLRPREVDYLRGLPYLTRDFVEILKLFQLQEDFVDVREADGGLRLTIRGPWLHTILFEVPLLAILSELHHAGAGADAAALATGRTRLADKIHALQTLEAADGFRFAEFGTRRRYSRGWQQEVIQRLAAGLPGNLLGTSNVWFAMEQNLTPIGTMGHEFLQACQALGPRLVDSQRFALEAWAQEYRGDLGIVLTDVIGLDAFVRDFDRYFCKLFDGVRQDSGDPIQWGERIIEHYRQLRIDPALKTLVFSDGLDIAAAVRIYHHFRGRARVAFGIGTHLTNDCGFQPPDMIIKMTRCNGQAVAKISDDPKKTLCVDPAYLAYLRQVFAV